MTQMSILALETITLGIFAHTIWPLWMPVFVFFQSDRLEFHLWLCFSNQLLCLIFLFKVSPYVEINGKRCRSTGAQNQSLFTVRDFWGASQLPQI